MIRVVDIETTGMEPAEGAEVIELGWYDVGPERRFGQRFFGTRRTCPPEVRAVHHIHPAEYDGFPTFSTFGMRGWLAQDDIAYCAAHNAEYESKFIDIGDIPWLCTYKAALRVWPEAPSHGNQALMYWLGLDTELDEGQRHPPHRALPDAYVTAAILRRLLCVCTVPDMVAWTRQPRLLPTCPIGKQWKGKPWAEVDWGFLDWMLRQTDMEADYKWNARHELERRRTEHRRGDA